MNVTGSFRPAPRRNPQDFSLASLLDGLAFALLTALLSFIFFASRIASPIVAALPSAVFTGCAVSAFLLLRQKGRRKRRLEQERQAYDLWLCDEMLQSEPARFEKFALNILLFQCRYSYQPGGTDAPLLNMDGETAALELLRRHPTAPVTAQDMLVMADRARAAGLKHLVVATTAEFTPEARDFATRLPGVEIRLYDGLKLASMAWDGAYAPPPEALEPYMEQARALIRKRRRQSRPKLASWSVSLRFALTAVLLSAMAWLTPFRKWYLICAAACLVIAAASLLFPNLKLFRRRAGSQA